MFILGYYEVGKDINSPSIEFKMKQGGHFNPMQNNAPRFGWTPYAMVTECNKPGNEHMAPGDFAHPHRSLIKPTSNKLDPEEYQKKIAFGSNTNAPRIQPKNKHELMMDKIWVRYDHFSAQEQAWGKTGAYISRHAARSEVEEDEEEKKKKKIESRKRDKIFSERIRTLAKTGKITERSNRDVKVDLTPRQPSFTKGSALGGPKGIPISTVDRFGYTPFALKTELQTEEFQHIGPGTYATRGEPGSIREKTKPTANKSAAFAMTTPRFGRKRRIDMSDGGASRRRDKEERIKRQLDIQMFYGDVTDDQPMQVKEIRPKTTR